MLIKDREGAKYNFLPQPFYQY